MDEIPNTENLIKENKKLKNLLLPSIILLTLSLSIIALVVVVNVLPISKENAETSDTTIEPSKDVEYDNLLADDIDVSEYTDIVLKNYEGLGVSIFQPYSKDSWIEEDFQDYYFPNIITYYPIDYYDENEKMEMEIVNSQNAVSDEQKKLFNKAVEDIQEKNIEADDLNMGELAVFDHSGGGEGYDVAKEIENVYYPHTDEVFSVLTVGGYQDLAWTENRPTTDKDIDVRMTIFVFAIKDNNIISLKLTDELNSLEVEKEDYLQCFIEEQNGEFEGYFDTICLAEVLSSGKYDEKAKELAEDLVARFELVE